MAEKENRSILLQLVTIELILLCLQVFIMLERVNGDLIRGPQNTAADDGQNVTLICRTDDEDIARWSVMLGNSEEEIYNGVRVVYKDSVFTVNDSSQGQFDLQFKASTKEVAMQFICVESYTGNSEVAEVTVLESPTCSGNATSYTCSVKYTGNWVPQIYWVKDGKHVPRSNSSENSDGHLLTGTLVVSELGDAPVCGINFVKDNYNGGATATNIPDYNKAVNCTSNKDRLSTIGLSDLPNGTTSHPLHSTCGSGCIVGIVFCGLIVCVCVVILVLWRKKSFRFTLKPWPALRSGRPQASAMLEVQSSTVLETEKMTKENLVSTNGGKLC